MKQKNTKTKPEDSDIVCLAACDDVLLKRIEESLSQQYELHLCGKHSMEQDLASLFPPRLLLVGPDWQPKSCDCYIRLSAERRVPVLMIVSQYDNSTMLAARKQGVVSFLREDFEAEECSLAVRNLLDLGIEKKHSPPSEFHAYLTGLIDAELQHNSKMKVKDICQIAHMSQPTLYRKVKRAFGMSPTELIMDQRLKRAAGLLINTEYSITQIAFKSGFSSAAYFSKVFKLKYGCTPSIYRKRYLK